MDFLIADTITAAFSRLSVQVQKVVAAGVFDLQMDRPAKRSNSTSSIKAGTDLRSARIDRDMRLVVYKTVEFRS